MNTFKKEHLIDSSGCLTVGELLQYIKRYNIPMDAPLLIQRIEDKYFEGIDISGMRGVREDGTGGVLPEGSKSEGWPVYEKEGEMGSTSQYHPAFTPVFYKEDPEFLFINLHY